VWRGRSCSRSGRLGGKLNATTLLLEPLTRAECEELIDAHGGAAAGIRERIVASADGNPLFVEEMLALVRENGDVRMPSTVHALLQARLDQLARDERTVIDGGAVEGEIFHRGAVVELTHAPDVEPHLASLVRKEVIHPAASTLAGDQAFRFRHLLIRDTAYDALPKATRAELHERFADWLERRGRELTELDEVLGYHLERAARYRLELGRPHVELERRAGRRLAAAGSKASLRSDARGAANLLRRALALLPRDDRARPTALLDCIAMLLEVGEHEERLRLIEEVERSADVTLRTHGRVARLGLRLTTEPAEGVEEAEAIVDEALAVFAEAGDDLGTEYAYDLAAFTSWMRSQAVATAAAIDQMLAHARRARSPLLADRAMLQLIGPLTYGPFEPEVIRDRLEHLPANESPLAKVNVLYIEAELARRDGRFGEALRLLDEAGAIERELGLDISVAINTQRRAEIMRDEGRLDEAIGRTARRCRGWRSSARRASARRR
jgi:tetratricopeptide (TPR) repeat protein